MRNVEERHLEKKKAKTGAHVGSAEPSRARGRQTTPKVKAKVPKRTPKIPAAKKADDALPAPAPVDNMLPLKRPPGRPKGTADTWTPEFIQQVADEMEAYTAASEFPTEAEFCYTRGIHPQRLSEFQLLRDARDMLFAKRQAMTIRAGIRLGKGDGPKGSFLLKLAANAGALSLVDKSELTGKDGAPMEVATIKRVVVDPKVPK